MAHLLRGLAAGAAGTTALNAVTYLDMALRGRPASDSPERTIRRAEDVTDFSVPGSGRGVDNRRSGAGALLGIASGLAAGLVHGALRERFRTTPLPLLALVTTATANAVSVVPMSALGVTDPRSWSTSSWLSDLVPHLAFGAVTAASYELAAQGGEHP